MIGSLGMAGSLFSHDAVAAPGANLVAKVSSTEEGKASIEALLNLARNEVRTMLDGRRPVVEALRDALLEHDELIGEQILEVIRTAVPAASPLGP